jgi:hypothetical protein
MVFHEKALGYCYYQCVGVAAKKDSLAGIPFRVGRPWHRARLIATAFDATALLLRHRDCTTSVGLCRTRNYPSYT